MCSPSQVWLVVHHPQCTCRGLVRSACHPAFSGASPGCWTHLYVSELKRRSGLNIPHPTFPVPKKMCWYKQVSVYMCVLSIKLWNLTQPGTPITEKSKDSFVNGRLHYTLLREKAYITFYISPLVFWENYVNNRCFYNYFIAVLEWVKMLHLIRSFKFFIHSFKNICASTTCQALGILRGYRRPCPGGAHIPDGQ